MENGNNQIPLNMAYLWEYTVIPDECEDYGPTLLFLNMPETQEERSKMFQEYGMFADEYLCERCFDEQWHPSL